MYADHHFTEEEVVYSDDWSGPLKLYVYAADGYHHGGQWFREHPVYPTEEKTSAQIRPLVETAIVAKLEVRITNADDFLIFLAKEGQILFPAEPSWFWAAVGAPDPV